MKNKTCGECRYFDKEWCAYHRECVVGNDPAVTNRCKAFEECQKPTNGDKIRQMSNEELVDFMKDIFNGLCEHCVRPENFDCSSLCHIGLLAWLNAPAESEGKDE